MRIFPRDPKDRLRRVLRASVLTALLGLASGYVLFLGVFPTIAFPVSGDLPLGFAIGLLLLVALVGGFASEDLGAAAIAAVLSILVSIVVATLMALSPVAEGFYMLDPGSSFAFIIHYGFPFIPLAFAVNIGGALGGYAVRERYILAPPSVLEAAERSQRK